MKEAPNRGRHNRSVWEEWWRSREVQLSTGTQVSPAPLCHLLWPLLQTRQPRRSEDGRPCPVTVGHWYVRLTLPSQRSWSTNGRSSEWCWAAVFWSAGTRRRFVLSWNCSWGVTGSKLLFFTTLRALWELTVKNKLPAVYVLRLETQEKSFCEK